MKYGKLDKESYSARKHENPANWKENPATNSIGVKI